MMIDHLIIFQKLYDLYLYSHKTVGKFPKSQRFLLSNYLLQTNIEMIRLAIVANSKKDRLEEQKELSVKLDIYRVFVRLAKDINFLSIKEYQRFIERVNEVGRLLTAWRKSSSG